MTAEDRYFRDRHGRDLADAVWDSLEGPLLCVSNPPEGYVLYTAAQWNNHEPATMEADENGHVIRSSGEYAGFHDSAWIVPGKVRGSRACKLAEAPQRERA